MSQKILRGYYVYNPDYTREERWTKKDENGNTILFHSTCNYQKFSYKRKAFDFAISLGSGTQIIEESITRTGKRKQKVWVID